MLAGEQHEEDATERIHVGGGRDRLLEKLLGRRVLRSEARIDLAGQACIAGA